MTSDLQMQALHCRTSAQLWKCVQELTGTQMKSKIVQLKGEFQRATKGTLKMDEYINKMKSLSGQLLLAASSLSQEDLILQTLALVMHTILL